MNIIFHYFSVLSSGTSAASANSIFITSTYIYIEWYESGDPNVNFKNYNIGKYW